MPEKKKYICILIDCSTVSLQNAIITKSSHDTSTLTLVNVTVADQGIYACVSGNHLGHVSFMKSCNSLIRNLYLSTDH